MPVLQKPFLVEHLNWSPNHEYRMIAGAATASQIQIHMTRRHDDKLRFALFRHGGGLDPAYCITHRIAGWLMSKRKPLCDVAEAAFGVCMDSTVSSP